MLKFQINSDKNKIQASAVKWNIIASLLYSIQSAILVLVVTRINGLDTAGIFTLAYTFTQMMVPVGTFSVRNYQVSDAKGQYSFTDYYSMRVITLGIMIAFSIVYMIIGHKTAESIVIIILLMIYRGSEVFEDVFHGEMQKSMRLDIAAKIEAIRIGAASVVFVIFELVFKSLTLAVAGMVMTNVLLLIILNTAAYKNFTSFSFKMSFKSIKALIFACLPLCLSEFLYNYLVNAPKYSIDRVISTETQALFSILFMPVFIINVFSVFIYKPLVAEMGQLWTESEVRRLARLVIKQLLIIGALSLVIVLGGTFIGLPILGWMYGIDTAPYRMMFAVLLIFGGFAAVTSFGVALLTIMRRQLWIIMSYAVAAVIIVLFMDTIVGKLGMWGGTLMYGLSMGIVMVIVSVVGVISICRRV